MNRLEKIQVEEDKRKFADKFARIVMEVFIYSMIESLYTDFDFDADRLGELFKLIHEKASNLGSGMVGLDIYKEHVKELTNFKIPDYIYEEI